MATDMIARAIAMSKASLVDGKVPASELPSYVDDVVEYASAASFPETGEQGKIYIALDSNTSYRWSGSTYIPITGQPDWNQSDNTAPDYIKNKPTLGTAAAKGVDNAPTASSTNLVESGGVESALSGKQATLTTEQQAAADSGITATKVTQYDKMYSMIFGLGDEIPDNSDLDDYKTPGVYYCQNNTHASTIDNKPAGGTGFRLEVSYTQSESRCRQVFILTNHPELLFVRCYTTSNEWTDWYKFEGSVVE